MRLICMHLTTHHVLVTPSLTRFTVNHHRRWSNLSIEMSFFDYVDSQLIHYYWSIFGISLQQLGQDCIRPLPYHRRGLPSKSCTPIYTGLGLDAIQLSIIHYTNSILLSYNLEAESTADHEEHIMENTHQKLSHHQKVQRKKMAHQEKVQRRKMAHQEEKAHQKMVSQPAKYVCSHM